MWSKPYVAVNTKPNKPIEHNCIGWGSFEAPIEIFWKEGITNHLKSTVIDWKLNLSSKGTHKKTVRIAFKKNELVNIKGFKEASQETTIRQ